jgi:hypothetical protein
MGRYDERLQGLLDGEALSQLEGGGGLLVLSAKELLYLDSVDQQRALLSAIKRIGVNKQSGNVEVVGPTGTLMEIPPAAFQKDDLKLFLESLRGHVAKAKSSATSDASAPPVTPPPPTPAPKPAPMDFSPPPAPADFFTPSPSFASLADAVGDNMPNSPTLDIPPPRPINIIEPPKTLPDDPADAIWNYDGAPSARKKPTNTSTQGFGAPTVPPITLNPTIPAYSKRSTNFNNLLRIMAVLVLLAAIGHIVVTWSATRAVASLLPSLTFVSILRDLLQAGALSLILWRLAD